LKLQQLLAAVSRVVQLQS